jgi:hypothetical protein
MHETNAGGCLCGAVRYRTTGRPERTTACHCTFCQRLTGSAFGIWVTFRIDNVAFDGDARQAYEHRSDESGRWIRAEFCARCGTTLGSTLEKGSGLYAIVGGTYDDTSWLSPEKHIWTRSAQPWVVIPADVPRFEKQAVASSS